MRKLNKLEKDRLFYYWSKPGPLELVGAAASDRRKLTHRAYHTDESLNHAAYHSLMAAASFVRTGTRRSL